MSKPYFTFKQGNKHSPGTCDACKARIPENHGYFVIHDGKVYHGGCFRIPNQPKPARPADDLDFNPYDDPEYAQAERDYEREQAAPVPGYHHPDCQCNRCYYGADADKWLHHPSEY